MGADSVARGHQPVMAGDVVALLQPRPDGRYLDCTVGAGGHARALLEAGAGSIIGVDRDAEALSLAAAALAAWGSRVRLAHADFREIDAVLDGWGVATVDGAVADLGMSSMQLETSGRGFSFRRDDPLDMRMDRSQGATAADLLADVPEPKLADVIFHLGEERYARRIARAIVAARVQTPMTTTAQLAHVVRRAVPWRGHQRIDPATRTFQALRIWVNNELDGLDRFVRSLCGRLAAGARLAIIAFHSLEDRVVKTVLRELAKGHDATLRLMTKRPLRPQAEEIARNPRARSARLRAAERIA